ncbi:MAG: DUF1553 domain-containing protein [Acidobacteria bacterium]|nr:DUF1553 domain-containing protein [Acidobacteriota bacterium]
MGTHFAVCLIAAGLSTTPQLNAQSGALSAEQAGRKLYAEQVRPLLEKQCQSCHAGTMRQGGLDVTTRAGLLQGGGSGAAVVPGRAQDSLLLKLISHQEQPHMPPRAAKLPAEVAALVALWIDLGAPDDQPVAAAAVPADGDLLFEKVRPVLETKCLACHGGKFKQAGLDVSTRDSLLRGSDANKQVVAPGNAAASLLVKKLRHEHEPGMPYQSAKLPEETIAAFVAWVSAKVPYTSALRPAGATEQKAFLHGSTHWAYQPPKRPAVPRASRNAWARNPIDRFIAAGHSRQKLEAMPEADKPTLLRRVYLDLIGLPPTPEQLAAFVKDASPKAYETAVDDLLASSAYGERWGRHWMDVWRYSDWYGLRSFGIMQNGQRHMWHWRDWIIESLNTDKGYDRMIQEMLAGDEIAPGDANVVRATGFLVRNYFRPNRNAWLKETVESVTSGFLATTMKCARCHDHKFDPLAQDEYYRLRAFFEPHDVRTDPLPGQLDPFKGGLPRVFDSLPRDIDGTGPAIYAETYRLVGGDEKNPDKTAPLAPGVPEILGQMEEPIQPVTLPVASYYPSSQLHVQRDLVEQAQQEVVQARAGLAEARAALAAAEKRVPDPRQQAAALRAAKDGYEKDLKPIFDKHCVACHGDYYPRSEFRVISVELLLEGGAKDGPAVIPGHSARSPLIQRLRGETEPRMPGEAAPLRKEEIERIANWIDRLSPTEPKLALQRAQEAVALAEKKVAWYTANLPAMEARVAADRAKFAEPADAKAADLAQAAKDAERTAELAKAEMNLLDAQQQLADAFRTPAANEHEATQVREKRVKLATRQVSAAQAALGKAKTEYTPTGKLYPKTSTGRRTALARWITRPGNPLTARVAVNHIWLRHFGQPLVDAVDDFGVRTKPSAHPELLDWLAVEFMENNWSMKHLHRLMVTSNTYRMRSSSAASAGHPNMAADAENRYLWRMNPRRMEAETLRDSLLAVAGELDRTQGGPELDEYAGQASRRRSLYFTHTPNENVQLLKTFDQADPAGCYRRFESIVPQQALALSNSELSFTQSRLLARKIASAAADARGFVAEAFTRILGRAPSAEEQTESMQFLHRQAELLQGAAKLTLFQSGQASEVAAAADPALRVRENLVHVLINRSEFVTIR